MGEWDEARHNFRKQLSGSGSVRGTWDLFFETLAASSFMSVGSSRTGNTTLVRIRVRGSRKELRLETTFLLGTKRANRVVEKVLQDLLPSKDVLDRLSVRAPVGLFLGEALGEPVLEEARRRGIRVLDDLLAALSSTDVGAKKDRYQQSVAMDEFRQAVRNANHRGCSYDEMEALLKEEAVRAVMDA